MPLSLVLPVSPLGMPVNTNPFAESCSSDKISCSSGVAMPQEAEGKWNG